MVPLRLTVLGTGYLGATHAACLADLGHDVLGIDVDEAKIAELAAGRLPILRARPAGAAAAGPGLRPAAVHDVLHGGRRLRRRPLPVRRHATARRLQCGRPQLSGRRGRRTRTVADPSVARRRQVHRAGRHRLPAGATDRRARASGQRGRTGLEPRVPARGLRRERHAAARTAWSSGCAASRPRASCATSTPPCSRRVSRWSSPTSRPPSWSRSPRTRSSRPRSRSSTRWRRSAR